MNDKETEASGKAPVSTGSGSNWALGLAVVFIGGLLLARNLGIDLKLFNFHNWWAIFILVAAFGPLQRAYGVYAKQGWNGEVANSLVSAVAIIILGLLFLLNLPLSVWWPVFIIIGGLYMLTNRDRH